MALFTLLILLQAIPGTFPGGPGDLHHPQRQRTGSRTIRPCPARHERHWPAGLRLAEKKVDPMPNAGWQAWRKAALPSGNRRSNFFTATHNLRFYERFNVMKTTTKLIGILLVFGLLTLVAGSASAQLKVQFDENGNGLNLSTGVPLQFGSWRRIRHPASRP